MPSPATKRSPGRHLRGDQAYAKRAHGTSMQALLYLHVMAAPTSQRDEHTKRDIKREVVYHHSLHHPHVIQLYDAFILPQYFASMLVFSSPCSDHAPVDQSHTTVSMECATGGNLYEYVTTRQYEDGVRKRLKEDEARWYFQQLILAVDYLHNVVVRLLFVVVVCVAVCVFVAQQHIILPHRAWPIATSSLKTGTGV